VEKQNRLNVLSEDIRGCTKCSLCKTPGLSVPGEGNIDAQVMFVGEAPGATEAETGRPFVGRAGKLLDNMIGSMSITRSEVFIANICKHRPPDNRKPTPAEMTACLPYLLEQIKTIQPKVIVALGNTALGGLTGVDGGVTKRCGIWEDMSGIKLMPCFHPSALLRNPTQKPQAWRALNTVKESLT
jgi:DNA polymerase